MSFTTGQLFSILPKIGGFISIIASLLVIRDILKKTKHLSSIPLPSAITLGKSAVCCVFSIFGPLMSTWMAPRGQAYYAMGTITTCEIQGFIATFSIVSFVSYFVALVGVREYICFAFCLKLHPEQPNSPYRPLCSLNFVDGLKSRGIMSDFDINKKKFKQTVLLLPLVLALAAASVPLLNDSYNFSGIYSCSIAPYPLGCDEDSTCTRGTYARRTVNFITFTFNAIAYLFAFLSFYTEAKQPRRYFTDTWPVVTLSMTTFCLSFLAGSLFIWAYGSTRARVFALYMSVILTPLTGFFMAAIYFYSSKALPRTDGNMNPLLSEPLIKNVYAHESTEEDENLA